MPLTDPAPICSVPLSIVVPPVYEFVPVRSRVPASDFRRVSAPLPSEIAPPIVVLPVPPIVKVETAVSETPLIAPSVLAVLLLSHVALPSMTIGIASDPLPSVTAPAAAETVTPSAPMVSDSLVALLLASVVAPGFWK